MEYLKNFYVISSLICFIDVGIVLHYAFYVRSSTYFTLLIFYSTVISIMSFIPFINTFIGIVVLIHFINSYKDKIKTKWIY